MADQADALRRLRRRALDRLNTLGQAIFHEMFVENARPDWPVVKIDEVVSNARTGPFGSQLLSSELVDGGIPVLGIDNVVSNEFAWGKPRFITPEKYQTLARYTVAPGDVLITIMGTCGRCIVVPQGMPTAINTKHICCLTPQSDRVDSEYLRAAFLMHPAVLKQLGVEAKGAVMPGLNMGIIKAIKLPLPGMQMQREFSARMAAARDQSIVARRYVNELEGLFASLQHRAFRGEL
ncbi:MAG: type I restriction enzyme S subunit [Paracoccaceae bacterium]